MTSTDTMSHQTADDLVRLSAIFKPHLPAVPSEAERDLVTAFKDDYLRSHPTMDHSVFAVMQTFSTIEAEKLTHARNQTQLKLHLYRFISTHYPGFKFQPAD